MQALPAKTVLFGLQAHSGCAVSGLDIGERDPPVRRAGGHHRPAAVDRLRGHRAVSPAPPFTPPSTVVTIEDPTAPTVCGDRTARGGPLGARVAADAGDRQGQHGDRQDVDHAGRRHDHAGACRAVTRIPVRAPIAAPRRSSPLVDVALGPAAADRRSAGRRREHRHRSLRRCAWTTTRRRGCIRCVQAGEAWRRDNRFTIRWQNPPQAYAPIARAWYRLCGPQGCSTGSLDGNAESAERDRRGRVGRARAPGLARGRGRQPVARGQRVRPGVPAPRPGGSARWPSSRRAPRDPLRVAVAVQDRLSGLDTGEIEMRQRGGNAWHCARDRPVRPIPGGLRGRRAIRRRRLRVPRTAPAIAPGTRRRPTGGRTARGPPSTCPARLATRLDVGLPTRQSAGTASAWSALVAAFDRASRHEPEAAGPADQRRRAAARRRHGAGVLRLAGRRRRPGAGRACQDRSRRPVHLRRARRPGTRCSASATRARGASRPPPDDFDAPGAGRQLHPRAAARGCATGRRCS